MMPGIHEAPSSRVDALAEQRLALLRNGYLPIPLNGKVPKLPGWQSIKAAESDILAWSRTRPHERNTGVLTGTLVGVDLDILDPTLAAEAEALATKRLGSTPLRRVGKAPKVMLVYRTETPFKKIASAELWSDPADASTKHLAEVMATGQQFVAFGLHPDTGKEYHWTNASPIDVPLAALPVVTEEQVRALIVDVESMLRRAGCVEEAGSSDLQETKKAVAEKPTETSYFRAINTAALMNIEAWVAPLFSGRAKLQATGAWRVTSADLGRPLEEDLSIHPGGVQDFGEEKSRTPIDLVMEYGEVSDATAAAHWLAGKLGRTPAEFGWKEGRFLKNRPGESPVWTTPTLPVAEAPPAPPFPVAALPNALARFVQDAADRMQAPVDLLAIPLLVTLAGCIGKDAALRPKAHDDWAERACLWGVLIQPPGSMKSAALKAATAPLRKLEMEFLAEDKLRLAQWEEAEAEADLRMKAWEKSCDKALQKDGADAALPAKPETVNREERPQSRRLVVTDLTVEKVAEMMAHARGLTLVRDELAGFLENMNRYSSGSDRQFYLEAWSGGSFRVDRIGRGEMHVSDLYLNVIGGIQPKVAKRLFAGNDDADGFFERFGLIAFPEFSSEWQLVDRWPEAGLRTAFNDVCAKLATADWGKILHTDESVEAGQAKPYCRFTPEAQAIFNGWLTDHMQSLPGLQDDPIAGFVSKARGLLVRLALVIHLAGWAAGEEADPRQVSVQSLGRALGLLENYCVPMWRRVFATFAQSQSEGGARRVIGLILEKGLSEISPREVIKRAWAGLRERRDVEAVFAKLADHGILEEPAGVVGRWGGRPSSRWLVNPEVHRWRLGDV